MSPTLLTITLLEAVQLTEQQEAWVLQCVAGDLTQYNLVRRAVRRVPNLDHRHQDASAWPAFDNSSSPASSHSYAPSSSSRPLQDTSLNIPPPEPSSPEEFADAPDYFPGLGGDDDSDSDDDYCSSCPSNEDEQTIEALVLSLIHI